VMSPLVELPQFLRARDLLAAKSDPGLERHFVIAKRPAGSLSRTPTA
jgi:hypothetical protein